MGNRKVGIEFYVGDPVKVARDVNKIAKSVGSVTKFGMGIGGTLYALRTVSRLASGFLADTISQSPQAVTELAKVEKQFDAIKTTMQQGLQPVVTNFIQGLGVIASTAEKARASIGDMAYSAKFMRDIDNQTRDLYELKMQKAGKNAWAGPLFKRRGSAMFPEEYDAVREEVMKMYSGSFDLPETDPLKGATQAQKAAQDQVKQMNEALDRQVYIQGALAAGKKHVAEMTQYEMVLEAAYSDDMEEYTRQYKQYEEGLIAVAKIQDQMAKQKKDAEVATKARQDVSKMNDELDREFQIIGRLNDSHERAAKMVQYESAVRLAYADSLETQNRMLAQYEDQLKALERHEQLVNAGKEFGDAWGTAAETVAMDLTKVREAVQGLITDIQRMVIRQTVSQPIANFMSQAFISAFSGGGGKVNAATPGAGGVHGFHGGGVPLYDRPSLTRFVDPALFQGAPRAHSGIGPGEMPAIIRKDEGVFTPGQMRALGRGSGKFELHVHDQSGRGVEILGGEVRDEVDRRVADLFIKDKLSRRGVFGRRS